MYWLEAVAIKDPEMLKNNVHFLEFIGLGGKIEAPPQIGHFEAENWRLFLKNIT